MEGGGLVTELAAGEVLELGAQGGELGADFAEDLRISGGRQATSGTCCLVVGAQGFELSAVLALAGGEEGFSLVAVLAGTRHQQETNDRRPQGSKEGNLEPCRRVAEQHDHCRDEGEQDQHDHPEIAAVAGSVLTSHGAYLIVQAHPRLVATPHRTSPAPLPPQPTPRRQACPR